MRDGSIARGSIGTTMPPSDMAKKKPEPLWDSGLFWTAVELKMVEVGGIEPPSEGTPSPALHA